MALGTSQRHIDVHTVVLEDNGSMRWVEYMSYSNPKVFLRSAVALRLPAAHEDWVHALEFDGELQYAN